jgi:hypothetical protein
MRLHEECTEVSVVFTDGRYSAAHSRYWHLRVSSTLACKWIQQDLLLSLVYGALDKTVVHTDTAIEQANSLLYGKLATFA